MQSHLTKLTVLNQNLSNISMLLVSDGGCIAVAIQCLNTLDLDYCN